MIPIAEIRIAEEKVLKKRMDLDAGYRDRINARIAHWKSMRSDLHRDCLMESRVAQIRSYYKRLGVNLPDVVVDVLALKQAIKRELKNEKHR